MMMTLNYKRNITINFRSKDVRQLNTQTRQINKFELAITRTKRLNNFF